MLRVVGFKNPVSSNAVGIFRPRIKLQLRLIDTNAISAFTTT